MSIIELTSEGYDQVLDVYLRAVGLESRKREVPILMHPVDVIKEHINQAGLTESGALALVPHKIRGELKTMLARTGRVGAKSHSKFGGESWHTGGSSPRVLSSSIEELARCLKAQDRPLSIPDGTSPADFFCQGLGLDRDQLPRIAFGGIFSVTRNLAAFEDKKELATKVAKMSNELYTPAQITRMVDRIESGEDIHNVPRDVMRSFVKFMKAKLTSAGINAESLQGKIADFFENGVTVSNPDRHLNINVTVDKAPPNGRTKWHCAIRYEDQHAHDIIDTYLNSPIEAFRIADFLDRKIHQDKMPGNFRGDIRTSAHSGFRNVSTGRY